MSRPFTAYLRVYEPLSAFGDPPDERLIAAANAAPLSPAAAAQREQEMWLRSQMTAPPRLLPGERSDGSATQSWATDVLVLKPEQVPGNGRSRSSGEPLVCPLEVRARSAAALVSFLGDATPALRSAVLTSTGMTMETARSRASAALSGAHTSALHVLSVTWTIPLPWFTLVDPTERRLVLGSGMDDPAREVSWRTAMSDARERVAEARELAENVIGDEGPTKVLIDTDRWLAKFHPDSAVELDYGGLVQLIDDSVLESDSSAEEVHGILEALRSGNMEKLADLFNGLRDYWGELASRERCN